MKVTVLNILNSKSLLETLSKSQMKMGVAYSVGKLLKEVQDITISFEERRNNLVKKMGKLDEKTGNYGFEDNEKGLEQLNKKVKALADEEIDLSFSPILLKDLGDIETTPIEIAAADWFIDAEDQKEASNG